MCTRAFLYFIAAISAASPAFAQDVDSVLNTGNTAWLLTSAALVMLMTPGLAFFYAGMVNRKNVVATLLQNYVALAVISLIWVGVGYSLVFSEGGQFVGGFDYVMLAGLETQYYGDTGIPMMAFMAFQMMFAIITPAIMTGAFAERKHFKAWLFVMALWCLLVYVPVAHWVWGPGGWIAEDGGLDFAGGLVVHITAGVAGLVAAMTLGTRQGDYKDAQPNNVPMVMLGAAMLWFGWFGFNAGSALVAGSLASYAFVNTFVGGATAFIAWMLVDWVKDGKPSAMGGAIGIVVGLVAITPAAGFVSISSAIIITFVAGVLCNLTASAMKDALKLDDSLDVFACHGLGGIIGAIMTGMYASKAINPSIGAEGIMISGEEQLFYANIIAVLAVAAYTAVVTWGIIKLVNLFTPVRVDDDAEDKGLDASLHGEMASFHPYTFK